MGKYDKRLNAFKVIEHDYQFTPEELDRTVDALARRINPKNANLHSECAECRNHAALVLEAMKNEREGYPAQYPQPVCTHPPEPRRF